VRLTFDSYGIDKILGRVGFGCWGLGGDSYGSIDQNDAIELVRYAYEQGIRTFDTSPLYGDGVSEQILGLSLREYSRKTFTLITKAGLFKENGKEVRDYRPERIKISVNESLSRLNTDFIDYFLIHSPNEHEFRKNYKNCFGIRNELEQGKIKNLGLSLKAPKDFEFAKDLFELSAIEFNLSLMDQRARYSNDELGNRSIFKVARTPYNFGFLTDQPPGLVPPQDKRNHLSAWPQEQFIIWHEFRSHWKRIADLNSMSLNEFALLFCLSHDLVDLVIPGFMNKSQVDAAVNVMSQGKLSNESMFEIYQLYTEIESKFNLVTRLN
jgi:aryl-alcohol dehydrogenase-like predicted oxidoreductase